MAQGCVAKAWVLLPLFVMAVCQPQGHCCALDAVSCGGTSYRKTASVLHCFHFESVTDCDEFLDISDQPEGECVCL